MPIRLQNIRPLQPDPLLLRQVLDEGDRLRILSGKMVGSPPHISLQLTEGRKREIKRLFAHFELAVVRLLRQSIGPVELGNLRQGTLERTTSAELKILRDFVQETAESD